MADKGNKGYLHLGINTKTFLLEIYDFKLFLFSHLILRINALDSKI